MEEDLFTECLQSIGERISIKEILYTVELLLIEDVLFTEEVLSI